MLDSIVFPIMQDILKIIIIIIIIIMKIIYIAPIPYIKNNKTNGKG